MCRIMFPSMKLPEIRAYCSSTTFSCTCTAEKEERKSAKKAAAGKQSNEHRAVRQKKGREHHASIARRGHVPPWKRSHVVGGLVCLPSREKERVDQHEVHWRAAKRVSYQPHTSIQSIIPCHFFLPPRIDLHDGRQRPGRTHHRAGRHHADGFLCCCTGHPAAQS